MHDMTGMKIENFLAQVRQWAEQQSDVQGVLLVGSHAQGAARPDSDVDLIILTHSPKRHLESMPLGEDFGAVSKCQVEDWGKVTSLRVWYEDGLEVEYGFALPEWAEQPLDAGTRQVIADGMRILFDREGALNRLSGVTAEDAPPLAKPARGQTT
jgi:uncharacterized protein